LQHEDLLMTLAEVAVTLAALSGVAGIVGSRWQDQGLARSLLLRNVALIGMATALFALLPLVFRGSDVPTSTVWRGCSSLAGLVWFIGYLVHYPSLKRDPTLVDWAFWLALLVSFAGIGAFAWNTFGPSSLSPHRYVLALLLWLSIAGLNFVVSVFSPRGNPPAA